MLVHDVLSDKQMEGVVAIGPNETVGEAVRKLCEHRIGALLVVNEQNEPVGIITERDVLWQVSREPKRFDDRSVSEIMSRDLICGLPDDNIDYVMHVMTQNRIRHLPIVREHKVVGLISIGDVIKSQLHRTQVENHMMKDYLHRRGEI